MEEKISLYEDDTLLYLQEVGSSLNAALALFNAFGKFSGICINWDKSTLFALDPQGGVDNPPTQLTWVEQFRYLDIQVGRDPAKFLDLNVLPLPSQLLDKCTGWRSLPLNLLGRISLLKMIFLPKFRFS